MELLPVHTIREAQELSYKLSTGARAKAISIRIPADPDILKAYNGQNHARTGDGTLDEGPELAARRRDWDAQLLSGLEMLLTPDLEHLEHILPSWHVPTTILNSPSLVRCTNLSTLILQWRIDKPIDSFASASDPAIYDAFTTSLYAALSSSPNIVHLRISLPQVSFGFSNRLLDRVLADDLSILPSLCTLDLTHCLVDYKTINAILSTHPGVEHLILDQGPTWSEEDHGYLCMESEDDDEVEEEEQDHDDYLHLGDGWSALGAHVALHPALALRTLAAANNDVPIQFISIPLLIDALRRRLIKGAESVRSREDISQEVRHGAVARVERIVLCNTWPVTYGMDGVEGEGKTRNVHTAGCAHLEGWKAGCKPSTNVWPNTSPDGLENMCVY